MCIIKTSDEIILMNNGHISQKGTPQEIYFQPKDEFVLTSTARLCLVIQCLRLMITTHAVIKSTRLEIKHT